MTNWAEQLISIVSLCLWDCLHQFSLWSGRTIFFSCHTDFRSKIRGKKLAISSFLGYLGEIESDSRTVWTCTYYILQYFVCTMVPGSVLPIFKSEFAVVDEIRLEEPSFAFWLAQLVTTHTDRPTPMARGWSLHTAQDCYQD